MNRLLTLFTFLGILFLSFSAQAQRDCGSMENLDRLIQENPQMQQNMDAIEDYTRNFLKNTDQTGSRMVVTIPVVVHVVWKTQSQNVSDVQIQSQLDVLNEDFRRTNSDANNTWGQAADVEIEFCLATVDPDGNSTSGIQRRKTNKRGFGTNDQMKFQGGGGIDAWPADEYMNMWVCNINSYLGYAQFPGGPDATDGVVIDYAYFGRGGSAQAPFDLGRTATHEVGHWLNLRHIWGDSPCGGNGDYVNDTPDSDGPNYGCSIGHFSCGSEDMVQNYMDYSDDACMNLFTSNQGDRMNALFGPGGVRASLLNSNGCGGAPTGPTCGDGVQNGNETGVDCGGPDCTACETATCSDGVQNGDEQGVDCGGSCPDDCTPSSCDAPVATGATSIKRKRATLNWNSVSGVSNYTARYRVAGSSGSWSTKTSTSTQATASGLNNNATYEWQVQSNCGGSNSGWSNLCTFTAGSSNSSSCSGARAFATEISLLPNPASNEVQIQWNNIEGEKAELIIYNSVGAIMTNRNIDSMIGSIGIDVSRWTNGMYFVRIQSEKGVSLIEKLIVQ